MTFEKRFFVLCPSFHGATLLAKLLNAHPDISALGDTYPSNAFDQTCGCGRNVSACDFWRITRERIADYYSQDSPNWLPFLPGQTQNIAQRLRFSDYLFRKRLNPSNAHRYFSKAELAHLCEGQETFLSAIFDHMPAPIFVDGVKSIGRLSCLIAGGARVDGIIQIKRNAADFVGSAMRNTGRVGLAGAAEHTLRWRNYHAKVASFSTEVPHHCLSYESLASDTDATLGEIFNFLGCPARSLEELREGLHREWHFMGNISVTRFDGTITRSTHELPFLQRSLVRAISGSPS